MGKKQGIQVSFVQPHYTRQECHQCHYVDKKNRQTQEHFH